MLRKKKRPFVERFVRALRSLFKHDKKIWRRLIGSKKGIQRGYYD